MASSTCDFGHAAGFVDGHPLGVFEVGAAEVLGARAARAASCRPHAANDSAAVVGLEELRRGAASTSLVDHLE